MSVISHSLQFDNICRTCLSKEQNMKSVFDTDCSLGDTLQLFEMLVACTAVQVQEDDALPGQICLSCIKHLARSFSFKRLCENSDSTLREILRKSTITDCEPLIKMEPSTDVALFSQETHTDIDADPLNIGMKFEESETNIDDLISDIDYSVCEKKYVENADDFQSRTIESKNNFDIKSDGIKVELMHDQIELEANALITDNEIENIECSMPDETEQPIYHCEQCNACFTVEDDLKTHSDTHRQFTKHKCKVCSEEFTETSELSKHMMVHDEKRRHACSECGKRFRTPYELRRHLITHTRCTPTDEKVFVCNVCDKTLASSQGLRAHVRAHTNKQFTCSTCDKAFSRKDVFLLHMKSHTGEKDCECSDCGKRFAAPSTLTAHKRIHTGERPYICNVCDKGFTQSTSLVEHARTHSGERPYVCDVCDKGFVTSSHLKRHMVVHTGEKPFECNFCPKAYANDNCLRQHMRRHTGERSHICVHCNKSYYEAYRLKVHLRTHTGEKS